MLITAFVAEASRRWTTKALRRGAGCARTLEGWLDRRRGTGNRREGRQWLTDRRRPMMSRRFARDFPILTREVYGKPLVYLDNAASAQKPKAVIDGDRQGL